MAKKKTFSDVLTKLVNLFKKDMYIINNTYCLGGPESEEASAGTIIAILEPDEQNLVSEQFDNTFIVFIKNIRNYKKEDFSDKWIDMNIENEEQDYVLKKRDEYVKLIKSIETWEILELNDEQKENLFTNKGIVAIPATEKFTLTITTTILPLIKLNNIDNVVYHILIDNRSRGGVFLVIKFIHDMFVYYNFIYYLTLEK